MRTSTAELKKFIVYFSNQDTETITASNLNAASYDECIAALPVADNAELFLKTAPLSLNLF